MQFFKLRVMAYIQVSRILFENEVCWVKRRHVYNNLQSNKINVTNMELIFGQLVTHDKMKLVQSLSLC